MEDIDQSQARKQEPGPDPDGDSVGAAAPDQARQSVPEFPSGTDEPDADWLKDMAGNQPTWFDRWGRRAALWLSGGLAALLVLTGAGWLYGERKVDSALEVLAMSARAPEPGPTASVPVAAPANAGVPPDAVAATGTVPPLVLLPAEEARVPDKPAVASAPAQPGAAKRAAAKPQAVSKVVPPSRHKAKTLAAKGKLKPAVKRQRRSDPLVARVNMQEADSARPQAARRGAPMKRCQTGDLGRDCLVDLCQDDRDESACRAARAAQR